MLVALDPGTRSPGLAVFDKNVLVHAERVLVGEFEDWPDGDRWLQIGQRLAQRVSCVVRDPRFWPVSSTLEVIFERPQWYAKAKSKGDPNGLAGLTGVAGVFIGILSTEFVLRVKSPHPADWIGQISKECKACGGRKGVGRGKRRVLCSVCHGSDWETPRGKYIRKRLTEAEFALVPDQNDAIDAVGIGLYGSGRLEPHVVLSNGRDGR